MKLDRRSLLLATGAAAAMLSGWASQAEAQSYPERPITVIVPFSPGGSTDLIARAVLSKVEENLGESIVFDYRPGAGTQVGLNALATAEPDGYTLGMATSSAVLQPIFTETRFVYAEELTPIAQFAATAQALFVHAESEWETLEDLIQDAGRTQAPFSTESRASATRRISDRRRSRGSRTWTCRMLFLTEDQRS